MNRRIREHTKSPGAERIDALFSRQSITRGSMKHLWPAATALRGPWWPGRLGRCLRFATARDADQDERRFRERDQIAAVADGVRP